MKISLANIEKIIENCTKKEIDFIIYVGQFQDEKGVVKGLTYKDVIENIYINKSTFYKLLYSLEKKNIIEINYINEFLFWELTIVNNVFENEEDYKKGYININFEVLHTTEFKKLTKSEKVFVINLIKINDFKNKTIKVTYKKIMEWTSKSLRSVRKFVVTLSKLFNISILNCVVSIECLKGFVKRQVSEKDIFHKHLLDYKLKKSRCTATEKDIKDVCILLKQYASLGTYKVLQVVENVITNYGTLVPKYINKLVNIQLNM